MKDGIGESQYLPEWHSKYIKTETQERLGILLDKISLSSGRAPL
jgi:hypothetical protein